MPERNLLSKCFHSAQWPVVTFQKRGLTLEILIQSRRSSLISDHQYGWFIFKCILTIDIELKLVQGFIFLLKLSSNKRWGSKLYYFIWMEDRNFYPLEKVFNRIIDQYISVYTAKNSHRSTSRATQKSGTPSLNGQDLKYSKIESSLSQISVSPILFSSIYFPLRSWRQRKRTDHLHSWKIPD